MALALLLRVLSGHRSAPLEPIRSTSHRLLAPPGSSWHFHYETIWELNLVVTPSDLNVRKST